eukprot:671892-Amphidinium_carterae.1
MARTMKCLTFAYGNSEPIYDILFDAQHEALQVVLLETSSGSRIAVQDILDKEGPRGLDALDLSEPHAPQNN